ncbi:MAG TPA: hypothetical protein DCG69_06480 [Bacteroidales bacterium]|nr:hypothetical protein [Bacteroidales bacterium]
MKTNTALANKVPNVKNQNQSLSSLDLGIASKVRTHVKRFIFMGSVAAMGLFFNSCVAGYVTTEPSYVEYSRPQRPNDSYVWVDGDWVYNRSSNVYVQKNGYWVQPRQERVYVTGHWQSTPRGKHWVPGQWQKKNSNGKSQKR